MFKAVLRYVGFAVAAVLVAGGYLGYKHLTGNFHEVVPGEFYRASQPSAANLAYFTRHHQIKSVINLRGENVGSPWYDAEVAASNALGIHHYDFSVKANRGLSDEKAVKLIALMREAPKPLLVHCAAGADRSGIASALYVGVIKQKGAAQADQELSLIYSHLPFSFSKAYPMDQSFERLKTTLGIAETNQD